MKIQDQLIKELKKQGFNIKKASDIKKTEYIRTGIFGLDFVLDKGIPQCEGGTRIEFWGPESTCKTTFALLVAKKYQEEDKVCAFIDGEKSYDPVWGKILGLNNDELLMGYPTNLEEYGDMLIELIPKVDLIITDSITSFIPSGEAERNTESVQVALQARINALIVRKVYAAIGEKPITFIFINQMRQKIGVMYGSPNIASGGNALKHFYNTRIEFRAGKPIKDGDEKIGIELKLNCIKNKKGVPGRVAEVDFYLSGEMDNRKSLFYAGIKYLVIERSGNTYEFNGKKEVGKDKFLDALDDKDYIKLEEEIWKYIK